MPIALARAVSEAFISGTSMASPKKVNLAVKLFAIDPLLTPAHALRVIEFLLPCFHVHVGISQLAEIDLWARHG
jgi:hypothetical protein